MCLLDERSPFDLDARGGASRFTLMRMPRWMIVDRYPRIGQHTAVLIQDGDPGASLLRQMLRHVHELAPLLDDSQSGLALTSIVQLLGMPRTLGSHPDRGMGWRAQAALTFIDARLADSGLNASDVAAAQRIGRRHLDEILLRETGQATAAHIWRRRLETAAAELRNPRSAGRTVAEIALDTGFKDAAHFARAFKQRYRSTPRMWRSPVVTYSETAAGAAR